MRSSVQIEVVFDLNVLRDGALVYGEESFNWHLDFLNLTEMKART